MRKVGGALNAVVSVRRSAVNDRMLTSCVMRSEDGRAAEMLKHSVVRTYYVRTCCDRGWRYGAACIAASGMCMLREMSE